MLDIRKSIGNTGNPCEILVLISCSWLLYLFITSWTFQSIRNDYVYQIKSSSMSNFIILLTSLIYEIWSNALITSINSAVASFFSTQNSWTLYTRDITAPIANL